MSCLYSNATQLIVGNERGPFTRISRTHAFHLLPKKSWKLNYLSRPLSAEPCLLACVCLSEWPSYILTSHIKGGSNNKKATRGKIHTTHKVQGTVNFYFLWPRNSTAVLLLAFQAGSNAVEIRAGKINRDLSLKLFYSGTCSIWMITY